MPKKKKKSKKKAKKQLDISRNFVAKYMSVVHKGDAHVDRTKYNRKRFKKEIQND